ncbi:MAG: hypothetical protein WCF78_01905 [archaeon]
MPLKIIKKLFSKKEVPKKERNVEIIKEVPQKHLFYRMPGYKFKFSPYEVINAKFLAREAYITESFVSRLNKQTKRPIIVVGIKRTGVIYTSSIENNKKIISTLIEYPSTNSIFEVLDAQNKLKKMMQNYRQKLDNPLFVFVDSSRAPRMPASLTGYAKDDSHLPERKSIKGILEKDGEDVKRIGFNWSNDTSFQSFKKKDYLPRLDEKELEKLNAILFNPSVEQKRKISYDDKVGEWESAPHDDETNMLGSHYNQLVLHFVNEMKKSYSKMKK